MRMYNDLYLLNQHMIAPFLNHYCPAERPGDLSPTKSSIASSGGLISRALGGLRVLWDRLLRLGNI